MIDNEVVLLTPLSPILWRSGDFASPYFASGNCGFEHLGIELARGLQTSSGSTGPLPRDRNATVAKGEFVAYHGLTNAIDHRAHPERAPSSTNRNEGLP